MRQTKKHAEESEMSFKRANILFGFAFVLFFFFQITGRDLARDGNIIWNVQYVLLLCGKCLVSGVLAGVCTGTLLCKWQRRNLKKQSEGTSAAWETPPASALWRWGLLSMAGILVCWLPGFLAYYPGICAYDTPVQMGQILEGYMIDHHPIMHTLVLKLCIMLGKQLGWSLNGGMAIYIVLQMMLLAGALSFAHMMLYRFGVKRRYRILVWLLCALFPFQLYMSISMTKDAFFGAFFLIHVVSLYSILRRKDEHLQKGMGMVLGVSILGMILFRANGRYALLVLLMMECIALWRGRRRRRLWGAILLVSLIAFLIGNGLLSGVFQWTKAEPGDRREMLSIPIQQFARCMVYHSGAGVVEEDDDTMAAEDKALINDFLLNEAWRDYKPSLADPVKRHTNTYVARYRTDDFLRTWFKLLGKYPGEFINAVLAVDAGYVYLNDTSHAYVNVVEGGHGQGYVQTLWSADLLGQGLYPDPIWEGLYDSMEKWADGNEYLRLPLLKYLFVPGSYLWIYVFLTIYLLWRKRYAACLPLSGIFGYFATLLLGPTVQLRYIYPLMLCLPFVLLLQSGVCEGEDSTADNRSESGQEAAALKAGKEEAEK